MNKYKSKGKSKNKSKRIRNKTRKKLRGGTINPFSEIGNIFNTVGSTIGTMINTLNIPPAGFENNNTNIPFQNSTTPISNSIKVITSRL